MGLTPLEMIPERDEFSIDSLWHSCLEIEWERTTDVGLIFGDKEAYHGVGGGMHVHGEPIL